MATLLKLDAASGPSEAERKVRVDLAAAMRMAAQNGWDELTLAHMTARSPDDPEHILMHPGHELFEEVTASTLHCLDRECRHVHPRDDVPHDFAFPFHRAIYDLFPEANAIFHLHTKAATAVTMQQQGLLMGNQYALWLGSVGYRDYNGVISTPDEGEQLAKAFGSGQVVLQRAHGFVLWGRSVREAYILTYWLNRACETQIMSGTGRGALEPYIPPQDIIDMTKQQARPLVDGSLPWAGVCWEALIRRLRRQAPDFEN